uniref:G-protein coupled receptor 158 n=1 Tax=Macrostomum lignano TaxID=282301 RepID=A0A1I8FL09_9PLAT
EDLGAGPNHNYTARWHRLNPLFLYDPDPRIKIDFIPDLRTDNQAKHQYDYNIYNSSSPGVMGKTPNVTRRYVAVSTSDIDFRRIDFDPCKRGVESPDHTYLSGVARCGSTTTCEPLPGYGFQRGGYMCHCLPGFRYPYWQNGPFLGRNIEQASDEEAKRFECIPMANSPAHQSGISNSGTGNRRRKRSADDVKLLVQLMRLYNASSMTELRVRAEEHDRQDQQAAAQAKLQRTGVRRFVQLAKSAVSAAVSYLKNATGGSSAARNSTASPSIVSTKLLPRHPLPEATQRLLDERKSRVKRNIETIADYGEQNIYYLGRLSSFSSDRYNAVKALMRQYVSITPENCGAQPPDRLVLPGEVGFGADKQFEVQARTALRLAHFLSAFQQNVNPDEIYGGVHGDKYLNEHQIYAGSEQRTDQKQRELSFVAEDAAGWEAARAYYERDWFKLLKERWASNTYGLEKFVTKPFVRFDLNGTSSKPFQRFPIYYRAPRYEDIYWSKPYFDCNKDKDPNKRHLNAWVITVAVPFFGISPYKSLEFSGVCVPIINNRFALDSYKCECRQGYEYPFNDVSIWFHAGGMVSQNYEKMLPMLTCREGSASRPAAHFMEQPWALALRSPWRYGVN